MSTVEIRPEIEVDEIAVAFVAEDGIRMRLRGVDRDAAIRRMHGRVATDIIAWRLYTTTRTVHRVTARTQRPATEHQALEAAA